MLLGLNDVGRTGQGFFFVLFLFALGVCTFFGNRHKRADGFKLFYCFIADISVAMV